MGLLGSDFIHRSTSGERHSQPYRTVSWDCDFGREGASEHGWPTQNDRERLRRETLPLAPTPTHCRRSPLALRGSRGGLLFGASTTEDTYHGVIPLVTRVLIEPDRSLRVLHEGERERPGSRPRRRILEPGLVVDRVLVDACEAFHQM